MKWIQTCRERNDIIGEGENWEERKVEKWERERERGLLRGQEKDPAVVVAVRVEIIDESVSLYTVCATIQSCVIN